MSNQHRAEVRKQEEDREQQRSGSVEAYRKIRELQEEVERLRRELADSTPGGLAVRANELPADYKGFMPRRVVVSLRPDLRRRLISLFLHLRSVHATTQHPRYHNERVHVDSPSHVVVWLLEQVSLLGEQG